MMKRTPGRRKEDYFWPGPPRRRPSNIVVENPACLHTYLCGLDEPLRPLLYADQFAQLRHGFREALYLAGVNPRLVPEPTHDQQVLLRLVQAFFHDRHSGTHSHGPGTPKRGREIIMNGGCVVVVAVAK